MAEEKKPQPKNIQVKMVPVYPLGLKDGEIENHWGVPFVKTGAEYLAMVDADTAESLVGAGRALLVEKTEAEAPAKETGKKA